jgi:hypothetical protein
LTRESEKERKESVTQTEPEEIVKMGSKTLKERPLDEGQGEWTQVLPKCISLGMPPTLLAIDHLDQIHKRRTSKANRILSTQFHHLLLRKRMNLKSWKSLPKIKRGLIDPSAQRREEEVAEVEVVEMVEDVILGEEAEGKAVVLAVKLSHLHKLPQRSAAQIKTRREDLHSMIEVQEAEEEVSKSEDRPSLASELPEAHRLRTQTLNERHASRVFVEYEVGWRPLPSRGLTES